jgi:chitin synthase
MSLYLLVCSFYLTFKAFAVRHCRTLVASLLNNLFVQNIPKLLQGKTQEQAVKAFLTPPIGPLVAAIVSTYGLFASTYIGCNTDLP